MWLSKLIKVSVFSSHLVNIFMSFQNIENQEGGASVRKSSDLFWRNWSNKHEFLSTIVHGKIHLPMNCNIRIVLYDDWLRKQHSTNFQKLRLAVVFENLLSSWCLQQRSTRERPSKLRYGTKRAWCPWSCTSRQCANSKIPTSYSGCARKTNKQSSPNEQDWRTEGRSKDFEPCTEDQEDNRRR